MKLNRLEHLNGLDMEQSISENLRWVIPGKLGGVRKATADELPALQASGIGAIISVMDDPSNLDLYEQAAKIYSSSTSANIEFKSR
jgi:hypothetical protein